MLEVQIHENLVSYWLHSGNRRVQIDNFSVTKPNGSSIMKSLHFRNRKLNKQVASGMNMKYDRRHSVTSLSPEVISSQHINDFSVALLVIIPTYEPVKKIIKFKFL